MEEVLLRERFKSGGVLELARYPGWTAEVRDQGHNRGFLVRLRDPSGAQVGQLRTADGTHWQEAVEQATRALAELAAGAGEPVQAEPRLSERGPMPRTAPDPLAEQLQVVHRPSISAEAAAELEDRPDGLNAAELAAALASRRLDFAMIGAEQLDRILSRRPDMFVRTAEGRWLRPSAVLRATTLEALEQAERGVEPPVAAAPAAAFVVFDLEATSPDPSSAHLLQIAAVRLDRDLREIARFGEYTVRAPLPVPPEISALTGITDADVEAGAEPREVLAAFVRFVEGAVLVAHNGSRFDGPLIRRLLAECGLDPTLPTLLDSLEAASVVLPMRPSRSLEALAEEFGVVAGSAHRAGADVDTLIELLRRLRARCAGLPPELRATLAELLEPTGLCDLLRLEVAAVEDPSARLLRLVATRTSVGGSPARPTGQPSSQASAIRALFGPKGPLAAALGATYEERHGQADIAEAVWNAFDRGSLALIEAGTGTGKTRAYVLPSIRWSTEGGGPVAISTHTKPLQDQILADLRFLERVPGLSEARPWTHAVLKGRRSYLCLYKLAEQLRECQQAPQTSTRRRVVLGMLAVWSWEADQATDDEFALGWVGVDETSAARTTAYGALCDDQCAEQRCPFFEPCAYFQAVRRAERADLVVLNHALLLSAPRWVDHVKQVVFDEAHALEEAATEALAEELHATELAALLDYISRTEGRVPTGLRERMSRAFGLSRREGHSAALALVVAETRAALEAASVAVHRFLSEHDHKRPDEARYGHSFPYESFLRQRPWLRTSETLRDLEVALRATESAIAALQGETEPLSVVDDHYHGPGLMAEARAVRIRLLEHADVLDRMLRLFDRHNRVCLLEAPCLLPSQSEQAADAACRRADWSFRAPPIEVGPELNRRLYQRMHAAVLTSATLTVDGSFAFVRDRLGLDFDLDRLAEHVVPSPFSYEQQALLALPGHLPAPRTSIMTEYLERLGQELVRYGRVFDGRTLALFTARSHVEAVAGQTREQLRQSGLQLYAQVPGARRQALVAEFRQNPRGLLAGVRSFWEGVDLPGQTLEHVIIAKLPFPNMGDPLLRARQQRLLETDPNANPFEDFLLPLTALQLKQGFGRLIRSRGDRGAVVIADRRLRSSLYRDVFLRSLPGPRLSEASDQDMYREIAAFLGRTLDESLLGDLPPTPVDEIMARFRLLAEDDESARAAKLQGALELFRLAPPPIEQFRPRQQEIMLASMRGDTLGILPTGAGKSLCFQLPALLRERVTLVISPLVALMKDQVDKLRRERGLHKARAIVFSVTRAEQEEILEDVAAGHCKLLYLAPERLRDQQTVAWLREVGVAQVVVDEAHCVSLWGPTFRPEFLSIREVVQAIGQPPVLALTATATPQVREDIVRGLGLDLGSPPRIFTTGFDRPNLMFAVRSLRTRKAKDRELVRVLGALGPHESAIVYVARRRDAERLVWLIETHCRVAARAYHAGLSPSVRASIQDAFVENGGERLQVIVATKAFGMGIDKPDVRYVIHYDMPESVEAYYQEAGRAGRDGQTAYCVLLYTPRDRGILDFFIRQGSPDVRVVRDIYARLVGANSAISRRGRRITTLGTDGRIYLDPVAVAQESDVAEPTLRVILHHLEQRGILRRARYDYGVRARLKLREPPDALTAYLRTAEGFSDAERELALRALETLAFVGADEQEFDTLELATSLGASPVELEGALLRLARPPHRRVVYRSWERGVVIEPNPTAPEPLDFSEDLFADQRVAATGRLEQMRRYALLGTCRRRFVLDHLGDGSAATRCNGCDRCAADLPWPWADVPEPASTLEGGVDPEWEVLRAVAWADGRYSRKQVEAALQGRERYGLGGQFPVNSHLLAADFFGRLQCIAKARFATTLTSMLDRGLIVELPRESDFGGTTRRWLALRLSDSGQAAFEARRIPEAPPGPMRDKAVAA